MDKKGPIKFYWTEKRFYLTSVPWFERRKRETIEDISFEMHYV